MFLVFQNWNAFVSIFYIENKDPNLDVFSLPLLEYICAHPNLDVSSLPLVECLSLHPNLDVPGLPQMECIC